jgi:hypothetical protein
MEIDGANALTVVRWLVRSNKHYKDNHASAAAYGRLANPFKSFGRHTRNSCAHVTSSFQLWNAGRLVNPLTRNSSAHATSSFQFENAESHINDNTDAELFPNESCSTSPRNDNVDESFQNESCSPSPCDDNVDAASLSFEFENAADDNSDDESFENVDEAIIYDNTSAESFPNESSPHSRDDNVDDAASVSFESENAEDDNTDAESFAKFDEAIFDDDKLQMIIDEFLIHLQTKLGGDKKLKDAKQFCRTFRNFIIFSFHKNAGEWKQLALEVVIRKILFSSYPLIGEFLEQYTEQLKSGTLLNYWNFLLTALRWFHFYCNLNKKRCKRSLSAFEDYMKRLRKAHMRAMKKERLAGSKTFEKLVEEGRLPSGGLQELFGYTKRKLQWVLSLKAKDFINKKVYNDFTDWLYSVFWVGMIQGRNGGLEDMKYGQRHGLLNPNGHETTSNFKTAMFHDAQALSSSDLFSIGMRIYVEEARRQVASPDMYDDDAPLFLTFKGEKEYRAGAKVEL